MITQTGNLAPADKKMYALRDTISCVENIPLIASSIMSKKIASGANKIVLDVTCGSGAFMKTKEKAELLARKMKEIGKLANKETVCILTNMDEPLGYAVGNNVEVIEAINSLKGNMPEDVKEVVLGLGSYMIKLAGKGDNIEENKNKILEAIKNGEAFHKFEQMVEKQGGNIEYLENTSLFKKSKYEVEVISDKEGYISEMNAEEVGKLACELGAGRIRKEDAIDYSAGIVLNKKVSEYVNKGDKLATIYTNKEIYKEAEEKLRNIIKVSEIQPSKPQTILGII